MAEHDEILSVGTAVWAEWDENNYYKGKVINITSGRVKVKFDDDDEELTYHFSKRDSYRVVLDKELNEAEIRKLKVNECVLVKLHGRSKTMHRGIVINVERVRVFRPAIFTIIVESMPDIDEVQKRFKSIRIFRNYVTPAEPENNEVEVNQLDTSVDTSVEILDIKFEKPDDDPATDLLVTLEKPDDDPATDPLVALEKPDDDPTTDPLVALEKPDDDPATDFLVALEKPDDDPTTDLLVPLGFIENQKSPNDLPETLSPEVLWGRENLIGFLESPTESENSATSRPGEETIGLSMDPLRTACSSVCSSESPQYSPIQYSTPKSVSDDLSGSNTSNTTFEFSSAKLISFEY